MEKLTESGIEKVMFFEPEGLFLPGGRSR